ncbi:MAG: sulfite exporter TauE/SafE family protein [Litoreibacter sp.]|nr:sulfite exporter TauE/SafE family protein [Litoreibacter sp.]
MITVMAAFAVAFAAGLVKGMVGFAMPAIMISGLASLMSPDLALAVLILPTLVANLAQALRQGGGAALASIKRFRLFMVVAAVLLVLSAQLYAVLSVELILIGIGAPIALFSLLQLSGWRPRARQSVKLDLSVGAFAGFVGGLSGIWGPPTVAYLTAIDTPKQEQLRIQGVIYGLGAVLLFLAHLRSGVVQAPSMALSACLVIPAMLGMWAGFAVQDRVDQATFRKITLWVLLIAGANLVRRGVF